MPGRYIDQRGAAPRCCWLALDAGPARSTRALMSRPRASPGTTTCASRRRSWPGSMDRLRRRRGVGHRRAGARPAGTPSSVDDRPPDAHGRCQAARGLARERHRARRHRGQPLGGRRIPRPGSVRGHAALGDPPRRDRTRRRGLSPMANARRPADGGRRDGGLPGGAPARARSPTKGQRRTRQEAAAPPGADRTSRRRHPISRWPTADEVATLPRHGRRQRRRSMASEAAATTSNRGRSRARPGEDAVIGLAALAPPRDSSMPWRDRARASSAVQRLPRAGSAGGATSAASRGAMTDSRCGR